MEKVRSWCGQPSDRGWLKNRTEQNPSLVFSVSDNPKRLWQTVDNSCTANPPRRYPPLVLELYLQTALLLFFASKISKLRVSLTGNPATSSLHSPFFSCYSTPISQFLLMLWTPTSTGSSRTVQTGNLIQITSQPGFSKNVRPRLHNHQHCQTVSYFRLVLCHQYLRNPHWIQRNPSIMIIIFSATACTQCIHPDIFISLFLTTVIQLLLFT